MALPQAPRFDPSAAVNDPIKMLQNIHVGLQLGGELARLGDLKAQIELERKQRKAAMAETDYKLSAATHAMDTLPKIIEAQRAQAEQQAAEARQATALASERLARGVPGLQVASEVAAGTNALASATADAGLASSPAPVRAQTLAAAQARGSWGVSPGSESAEPTDDNPAYRESTPIQEIDQETGNTVEKFVTINTKTGKILAKSEPVGVTKLAEGNKTALQAADEARGLVTTYGLLDNVKNLLSPYVEQGKGGMGQGAATIWANKKPEGMFSLLQSAIGRAAQSGDTQSLTAAIASLASGLTSAEFGKTITKSEMEQLAPFIPAVTDIAQPDVLAKKLVEIERRLQAKVAPLEEQKVFKRLNLATPGRPVSVAQAARDSKPAPAAAPAKPTAVDALKAGKTVIYQGKAYVLGTGPDGKPALVPAGQ